MQAVLGKAVLAAQLALIGIVVFGDQLFAALGMPVPDLYNQVKDKKFMVGMATWFLGNMLQSSLHSTGAFEIFFNGTQVYECQQHTST